ncbi:MAG TPA: hypothetical protein DF712_05290 [Balneola sp.]|nr:hypothetical protein [Balneola sp.]
MMMMAEAFDALVELMVSKLNESVETANTARAEADDKSADEVSTIAGDADSAKDSHTSDYEDARDANVAKYTAEYNEAKKGLLSQVYDAEAMAGLDTINMPLFVDAMLTAQGNVNEAIQTHANSISDSILKEVNRRGWSAEYVQSEYAEGAQVLAKEALESALAVYEEELASANDELAKAEEDKAAREEEWAAIEEELQANLKDAKSTVDSFKTQYAAGELTNQEYHAEIGAFEEAKNEAQAELDNQGNSNDRAAERDANKIAYWTERADECASEVAKKNDEIASTIAAANGDIEALSSQIDEVKDSKSSLEDELDAINAEKEAAEKEAKVAVSEADDAYTAAKAAYDEANDADPNSPETSAALKDMGDKYLVLKTKEDDFSDIALPYQLSIIHMEARVKTYAMEIDACEAAKAAIEEFVA